MLRNWVEEEEFEYNNEANKIDGVVLGAERARVHTSYTLANAPRPITRSLEKSSVAFFMVARVIQRTASFSQRCEERTVVIAIAHLGDRKVPSAK